MVEYAFLDDNNIVIQVIEGPDEGEVRDGISDWEAEYTKSFGSTCKRVDVKVHKNNAGMGYFFDKERNAFIAPKLHESCIFNEETCQWEFPVTE